MGQCLCWRSLDVEVLCQFEPELEDCSNSIFFLRRVCKPKESVEGPNSSMNFFIYGHNFWRSQPLLCFLCCLLEKTVLSEFSARSGPRLINRFGVRVTPPTRRVVSFVNQNSPHFFYAISVRRICAPAHQQHTKIRP